MHKNLLRIRTKDPVANVDSFNKEDFYITAELRTFDIINQNYQVVYYKEIPEIEKAEDGSIISVKYRLERAFYFPSLKIEADAINYVLGLLQRDLNKDGRFIQNIQSAMHDAFIIKVGSDGRYGLDSSKWEKVIDGVPESQLNKVSISSFEDGDILYAGDIELTANITNPYEVESIEFYVDGTIVETILLDANSTEASYLLTMDEGSYNIQVVLNTKSKSISTTPINITCISQ